MSIKADAEKLVKIQEERDRLEERSDQLLEIECRILEHLEDRIEEVTRIICKLFDVKLSSVEVEGETFKIQYEHYYLNLCINLNDYVYGSKPLWENSGYCDGFHIEYLYMDNDEIEKDVLKEIAGLKKVIK